MVKPNIAHHPEQQADESPRSEEAFSRACALTKLDKLLKDIQRERNEKAVAR